MGPRLRLLAVCALAQILLVSFPLHATRRTAAKKSSPAALSAAAANNASGNSLLGDATLRGNDVLRAQILLDRAHFSPGELDARYGGTMRGAVTAYNAAKKIGGGARVTAATWKALNADNAPVIVGYTLTAADLAAPFAASGLLIISLINSPKTR